jgi:hypothetical protein
MNETFRPTLPQGILLALLTAVAVGCALYLRYHVIENAVIGVACDTGPKTWFCALRTGTIALFDYSVFGWVALAAAILHLIRPGVPLLAIGLLAAGFGIVLYRYNVLMSGLAVGLMILAFARPARRPA